MTNLSVLQCRKCWYPGSAVSKSGPGIPAPPTSQTLSMHSSSAFVIVVIALAVSALLCMCLFILLFRRGGPAAGSSDTREDSEHDGEPMVAASLVAKGGHGGEGFGEGSDGSGQSVELVVMAGEDVPTFLAHPVKADLQAKVVDCPPLHL